QTVLECHIDSVARHTWEDVERVPLWDPNMDFSRIITKLTETADIVTYGGGANMLVSARDLVTARIYRKTALGYRMAFRSVNLDEVPETKDRVRAHLYLGALQLRPHPEHPDTKTIYDVITLFDLKGMIPKMIINSIAGKIMVMDTEMKVKHFKELAE
ncbi:hypothetical protein PMAYCL1PPCAC_00376, partial [Pristionchus mayeri]